MATAGDRAGAGAQRAFVEHLPAEGSVRLGAEESRHLVRSRRVGVGDQVVLFDGRGGSRFAVVREADPRATLLDVLGPAPDREPRRPVRLAISPPEAGRTDTLLAALAELGVAEIVWIGCARTEGGRLEACARRAGRQERLVREAAKVNGRNRLLKASVGGGLESWLRAQEAGMAVLLDPDPEAPPLWRCLPDAGPLPWFVIGPEGGLEAEERELARALGHGRARLGVCVLRTATAAIASAAVAIGFEGE